MVRAPVDALISLGCRYESGAGGNDFAYGTHLYMEQKLRMSRAFDPPDPTFPRPTNTNELDSPVILIPGPKWQHRFNLKQLSIPARMHDHFRWQEHPGTVFSIILLPVEHNAGQGLTAKIVYDLITTQRQRAALRLPRRVQYGLAVDIDYIYVIASTIEDNDVIGLYKVASWARDNAEHLIQCLCFIRSVCRQPETHQEELKLILEQLGTLPANLCWRTDVDVDNAPSLSTSAENDDSEDPDNPDNPDHPNDSGQSQDGDPHPHSEDDSGPPRKRARRDHSKPTPGPPSAKPRESYASHIATLRKTWNRCERNAARRALPMIVPAKDFEHISWAFSPEGVMSDADEARWSEMLKARERQEREVTSTQSYLVGTDGTQPLIHGPSDYERKAGKRVDVG
ncbi:hypothetical protein DACRYDRAFT_98391 [Dacryopinax primogenitus]|uniref:Uncharacterized protein n=1 Tax=Dacryopinax primogenitus (strain DJM 731) TaxID=1858805 RepID=M5G6B6_DACPD|nr:uncharacterized protein DACRYDRAFT_98391 [Dacryopinax primogenitus]EJU05801.1 hypothetical protein DACRYDRAFT_98391 [Dacryopinax primogenitus]